MTVDREMHRSGPIVSPLLWSVRRRLAVAAATAAGLWIVVGWALDWWK